MSCIFIDLSWVDVCMHLFHIKSLDLAKFIPSKIIRSLQNWPNSPTYIKSRKTKRFRSRILLAIRVFFLQKCSPHVFTTFQSRIFANVLTKKQLKKKFLVVGLWKTCFDWWRIHENSGWMVLNSSRRKKVCIFNFLRFHKESTLFF